MTAGVDAELDAALEGQGLMAGAISADDARRPATAKAVTIIGDVLSVLIKRMQTRVAALERRVVELEGRPLGLMYRGVWDPDRLYQRDEGVTHSGSLWAARLPSQGVRPDADAPDPRSWQLVAKRGSDARHR